MPVPLKNYYILTPSMNQTVVAQHAVREEGLLIFKIGTEKVAEFAPGGWLSWTYSEREVPAPKAEA